MHYDVGTHMRHDCFRGKGPVSFYVYEWIWRDKTIYVGRGGSNENKRYEMFFRSKKYGTHERHSFIFENKAELKCRFAVTDVSLDAAKEAEALLVAHWLPK